MSVAEKISITLPSEMVSAIKERVEAGHYASASEVLREAMRLWLRQEEEHQARLASIRARVQESMDDPRPNLSGDEMRGRLDALFARHRSGDQ